MADKDKNDNVEHKKKMQKEKNLEKEVVKMLIEEYGYSKTRIVSMNKFCDWLKLKISNKNKEENKEERDATMARFKKYINK